MKCSSHLRERSILVTGATGFLGTHLRARLVSRGYRVLGLDCRKGEAQDVELNLASPDDVANALRDGMFGRQVDVVVHLAARLVGAQNPNDLTVLHDNINMTAQVAHLALALSAQRVVHASSMAVYPNQTGVYNEEARTYAAQNSEGMYGLSKICSEQLLTILLRRSPSRLVHLRLAQVYGPGMRSDRILSVMEDELRRTNRITVYGAGERESNFIPIEKVLDALCFFIDDEATGVFNIGDRQMTYRQLAEELVRRLGDEHSVIAAQPEGCRERVVLDCSRYQQLLARRKAGK